MYIASQLKEQNIAEYLLYMWQVEDLLRAYGLDAQRVSTDYIARFDYSDAQKQEVAIWYANLADMMRQEGVKESGHLQINRNTLTWLTELHSQLLQSTKQPFYHATYYKALPYIVELRAKDKEHPDKAEIETCLETLYGIVILKAQKKEISAQTAEAVKAITSLIALLAELYRQDKQGTLELE